MKWLPWVQEVSRFSAPPCFHWSLWSPRFSVVSSALFDHRPLPWTSSGSPGGAEEGSDAGLINFSLSAHSHRCPIHHLWNCRTQLSSQWTQWPQKTEHRTQQSEWPKHNRDLLSSALCRKWKSANIHYLPWKDNEIILLATGEDTAAPKRYPFLQGLSICIRSPQYIWVVFDIRDILMLRSSQEVVRVGDTFRNVNPNYPTMSKLYPPVHSALWSLCAQCRICK